MELAATRPKRSHNLGEDFFFGAVSLQKQKGTKPALR